MVPFIVSGTLSKASFHSDPGRVGFPILFEAHKKESKTESL